MFGNAVSEYIADKYGDCHEIPRITLKYTALLALECEDSSIIWLILAISVTSSVLKRVRFPRHDRPSKVKLQRHSSEVGVLKLSK
jgi:hypothetical protein